MLIKCDKYLFDTTGNTIKLHCASFYLSNICFMSTLDYLSRSYVLSTSDMHYIQAKMPLIRSLD